jgi:hypothetical protein
MSTARHSPWDFVCYLHSLQAKAGQVALKQYVSSTHSNGGNDSTHELFKSLRWYHEGGNEGAQTMNQLIGGTNLDLALKGQGSGSTFIQVWDFMCRNKELLKKLHLTVYARRKKGDSETKVFVKKGNLYDLYFANYSEQGALELMVADHFFGIDCIGFTGQFLVYTGEWPAYVGTLPSKWADKHCKEPVNAAKDIRALDFLVWVGPGHIAIVDEVFDMPDGKTVRVDICQSSSGGPQLNQWVLLQETKHSSFGRTHYKILHRGTPAMPVCSDVYVMRRANFCY